VVCGDAAFGTEVMAAIAEWTYAVPWRPEMTAEVAGMRERLEASRSERSLKRGFGGIADIEFLVQLLQLKYGGARIDIRATNTWDALAALHAEGLLTAEEHAALRDSYEFLREVESRLRIVHNRSLDELPQTAEGLDMLARRLGFEAGPGEAGRLFLAELERHTTQTRELFVRIVEREKH
jgi:glutamate-ammonia-ligase adenylyltransferase